MRSEEEVEVEISVEVGCLPANGGEERGYQKVGMGGDLGVEEGGEEAATEFVVCDTIRTQPSLVLWIRQLRMAPDINSAEKRVE
jgi:hypothetical protein